MKASRDQLKALMKEILVEILSEGLGNVQPSTIRQPVQPRQSMGVGSLTQEQKAYRSRKAQFDPRLDTPIGKDRGPTDALREAIKRESGGNPIMADILADTAMTTLPSQLSHGDAMGQPGLGTSMTHAPVQQEQFNGDPSEIFEGGQPRNDGSSHWADLAFAGGAKKSL